MRTLPRLGALLLAAAVAAPDAAGAVTPAELETKAVRERVDEYLAEYPATVKDISGKVGVPVSLRGDQITYEKTPDRRPKQMLWRYATAKELLPSQEQVAKGELDQLLSQVLGDYKPKGKDNLLTTEGLKEVRAVFEFKPVVVGTTGPKDQKPPKNGGGAGGYTPPPRPLSPGTPAYPACGCWAPAAPVAWAVPSGYASPSGPPGLYYDGGSVTSNWRPAPAPGSSAGSSSPAAPRRLVTKDELLRSRAVADPGELYGLGFSAYWGRDFGQAEEYLEASLELDSASARGWYYLALARRERGKAAEAVAAAEYASALEALGLTRQPLNGQALERIQGASRQFLASAAGGPMSRDAARRLLAKQPPLGRTLAATASPRTNPALAASPIRP